MQFARRASLIVVLLLFASVGTAFAGCAWVLWVLRPDQAADYDIAATYVKLKECVAKLDETERIFRAPTTTISRDASTVLNVMFREHDGSFESGIRWLCAPDTVDPRGAKR